MGRIRRQSSDNWDLPGRKISQDAQMFAQIQNLDDRFSAQIDLKYFSSYDPEEIKVISALFDRVPILINQVHRSIIFNRYCDQVTVRGLDLYICCRKENPNRPDAAPREINRVYRLPEDADVDSIHMKRDGAKVVVEGKKAIGYGKSVSFAIVDVTQSKSNVTLLKP